MELFRGGICPGEISGKVTDVTTGGVERLVDSSSRTSDQVDRDGHEGGLCLQQGVTHPIPVQSLEALSDQERGWRWSWDLEWPLVLPLLWSLGQWPLCGLRPR